MSGAGDDQDKADRLLAADYVLDLLDPAARRQVAARLPGDPHLQALVSLWTADPDSLVEAMEEIDAPPRIWGAILGQPEPGQRARPGLRGFVTSLGIGELVIGTAAAALLAFGAWEYGWMTPETVAPADLPSDSLLPPDGALLVAQIGAPGSAVQFLARFDPALATLRLDWRAGVPGPGRNYALWLLEEGAAAEPLVRWDGTVDQVRVPLTPAQADRLPRARLILTEEPADAGPDAPPSGAVLASGQLAAPL